MTPVRQAFAATAVSFAAAIVPAAATTVGGAMTVDNGFVLYIGTDDAALGTQVLTGDNWGVTYTLGATALVAPTLYLHVVATDGGAPAGFLGEFSLSDSGYSFGNGTQHLLTNTSDWKVRQTSFADTSLVPASLGSNGVGPWGPRPGVSASAQWLWSPELCGSCTRYFSATVSAVPEPQTLALWSLGLLGVVTALRRRGSARFGC